MALLALCAFMVAQNFGLFGGAGMWIWLLLCGALFLFYPILQKPAGRSVVRCFLFLCRVLLIFFIGLGFGLLFDYWVRPRDLGELPMMASLFGIPALSIGIVAFIIGSAVRMARTST